MKIDNHNYSLSTIHYSLTTKVNTAGFEKKMDFVAIEEPLEIRLGFGELENRQQKSIAITMRTPGNDFELAIGFLFSENIIQDFSDVLSIRYCTDLGKNTKNENVVRVELRPEIEVDLKHLERNFYISSSCGVCGKASIEALQMNGITEIFESNFTINATVLYQLPAKLRDAQRVFELTGGIHGAALFDIEGNLQMLREDVGRHNALDKLIGANLISVNIQTLDRSVLLLSGRISFELVQKAAKAKIPIIVAIGSPSSLAVELAESFGITLIGFLKSTSFNIYSGEARVFL